MHHSRVSTFSRGFKGLPNGWKPISQVTFVVGENSTGKTSLFDLITILDSSPFNLFGQILGVAEGLDQANDVITRFGSETSVTMGYIAREQEDIDGEAQFVGVLVSSRAVGESLETYATSVLSGRSILRIRRNEDYFETAQAYLNSRSDDLPNVASWFEGRHFSEEGRFQKLEGIPRSELVGPLAWFNSKMLLMSESNPKNRRREPRIPRFLYSGPGIFSVRRYGPIRKEAQRIFYERKKLEFEPSGSHYPYFLRSLYENRPDALKSVQEFGRASGLFDKVRVATLSGDGAHAFSILYEKFGKDFHADELGYGLGQIIPIVTDLLTATPPYTFLIQQPEVHLHPKAQAAFGEMLHRVATAGCSLIVETHSDFVIDRFRIMQAVSDRKVDARVLFFEKSKEMDRPTFSEIPIDQDGKLVGEPESYRSFFVNESISVFESL